MRLKAGFVATATGALLLLAACGGGGGGDGGSTPGNGGGGSGTGGSDGGGSSGSGGSGGNSAPLPPQNSAPLPPQSCQAQAPTTIVGGDLFVAEKGPVGITLLSNGGFTDYVFWFAYDNVFGIDRSAIHNPQDKFGVAAPFPAGTSVGTSTQLDLQPQPAFNDMPPPPSTFPKGIPVQLLLQVYDGQQSPDWAYSSTASMLKDIPFDAWHTASVTYGVNNTATVTFIPKTRFGNVVTFVPRDGGAGFSVGLTNVTGSGSPTGAGSGC
jgi:hypothetical protein